MSATAEDGGAADRPTAPADADDRDYFRAIEDAFVRLRGAPLLLSPTDFQVAMRWRREGVPVALVVATLEEVFARRRERAGAGARADRINSLRYCAPAVARAWAEVRELRGPARAPALEPALDVAARVGELAHEIAEQVGEEWALRARALRELASLEAEVAASGAATDAEAVEARLRALDETLLVEAETALEDDARVRLDADVTAIVDGLRARVPAEELAPLRTQLRRQRVRRLVGLPLLTLFGG